MSFAAILGLGKKTIPKSVKMCKRLIREFKHPASMTEAAILLQPFSRILDRKTENLAGEKSASRIFAAVEASRGQ